MDALFPHYDELNWMLISDSVDANNTVARDFSKNRLGAASTTDDLSFKNQTANREVQRNAFKKISEVWFL